MVRDALTLIAAAALLTACGIGRLAGGQLALINGQVRLDRAIEREQDPERRRLLAEVPEIRRFAAESVGLFPGKSYTGYYETEAKGLTYVVTACERLRLEPYAWWFPVAGKVEYRSYWDEEDAIAEARDLEAQGYDTWISPSRAYSTLGFFRDPVITTMLRDGLPALVDVLVHELAHARLYVPGHTDWNESLASFVGERGAELYFQAQRFDGSPYREEVTARAQRKAVFDQLVATAGQRLEQLYASSRPDADKLREREAIFVRLQTDIVRVFPKESPETWRMNNARIVHFIRYSANSGRLEALWKRSGQNFRKFWTLAEEYSDQLD
ncbi:MAG TPA: aminopeptidase [Polyangiales bacterium]|nr:aminopeptidase [Polyangiales bacterium]